MSGPQIEIVEYTDPASAWAWGSEPKLRLLRWRYGHLVQWRQVMGGMVDNYIQDSAEAGRPDADVRQDTQVFLEHWRQVSMHTSMPYPASLRSVNNNTKLACMAVKAAQNQDAAIGARVLRRLREWLFLVGEPLDNKIAIIAAVSGLEDLDIDKYVDALDDPTTLVEYQRDWDETRRPTAASRNNEDEHFGNGRLTRDGSRWRYQFPTIVMRGPAGEATVAGWQPLDNYQVALDTIAPGTIAKAMPDPTTNQVIGRWGTAADTELLTLCGPESTNPTNVVAFDWGNGIFYQTEQEAKSRGLT